MFSPMWSLMCTLAATAGDTPAALTQHVMVDAPPVAPGGPFSMLMPLAIVVVIMYFLVFRPQQQELKAHEKLIAGLVKGDEVQAQGAGGGRRAPEPHRGTDHHRTHGNEPRPPP